MTFGGVLATWLIRQDRRIGARLTRKEHEEICESKHKEITATLARIESAFRQEAMDAATYRQRTTRDIHRIDKRVAVLKATLGQPDDPDDGEES